MAGRGVLLDVEEPLYLHTPSAFLPQKESSLFIAALHQGRHPLRIGCSVLRRWVVFSPAVCPYVGRQIFGAVAFGRGFFMEPLSRPSQPFYRKDYLDTGEATISIEPHVARGAQPAGTVSCKVDIRAEHQVVMLAEKTQLKHTKTKASGQGQAS